MRERVAQFDDALIDRVCQPIVDRLGAKLPVDCYRLARTLNDGAALAWILSQAGGVAGALAVGNVPLAGAQGLLIVIGLAALTTLRRVFDGRQGPRSSTGARANPLRPAMFLHRLGCLLGLGAQVVSALPGPAGFAGVLIIAVSLLTAASVYIGACSAPPPQRHASTNRAWNWRTAAARNW
jgi:hypothetical protein